MGVGGKLCHKLGAFLAIFRLFERFSGTIQDGNLDKYFYDEKMCDEKEELTPNAF